MRFRKRRVRRIRDELRLTLRERFGLRTQYSRQQIDAGREELGFDSVEDALVAYTLFGPNLVPDFAESLGIAIPVDEIRDLVAGSLESAADLAELVAGDD